MVVHTGVLLVDTGTPCGGTWNWKTKEIFMCLDPNPPKKHTVIHKI